MKAAAANSNKNRLENDRSPNYQLPNGSTAANMKRDLLIFRDGNQTTVPLDVPLLDGEQGNMQTLDAMAQIVIEDRIKPDIRKFVLREIVGDIHGHDAKGEVQRIFEFAQKEITYRSDPFNVERVADVWSIMYALSPGEPEGDCGIKSIFIASCCAVLGHKPFFVVAKQRQNQAAFNHVYNAVLIDGQMKYYDATPEDKPAGWQLPAWETKFYKIF